MRLATLVPGDGRAPRAAAVVGERTIVDVAAAARRLERRLPEGDLVRHVPALESCADGAWLADDSVACVRRILAAEASDPAPGRDRYAQDDVRLGPPVLRPGKFIATGRNYGAHLKESQAIWAARGREVVGATFPTAFVKFASAIVANGEAIRIPPGVTGVDYEIELAVVIGKPAYNIDAAHALDCVAGYTICNDIGARHLQKQEMEHQIGLTLSKNFRTFAPLGPWLVTRDEVPDPQALELTLTVNGEVRQHASTADMIFDVRTLVAYWSRLGLAPGDVISTGTPSGVALARPDPDRYYLKPGDVVEATIERIGTLRSPVEG